MSRFREWDLSCKVYVGNLGSSASKYEIERVFSKYGPIKNVWVARNPPGFAFVEFEDSRDAEDSVRGLDGTRRMETEEYQTEDGGRCCGTRIRVEMSSGRTRRDARRSRSRSPRRRSYSPRPHSPRYSPRRSRSRSAERDRSPRRSYSRDRRSRSVDSRDRY